MVRVSASEFAFLALGLVLGVIVGAALVVFVRSRAPSPEVRLTVTPDSVPRRRSTTLAEDAFSARTETARGGPADKDEVDRGEPAQDDNADRARANPGRAPGGPGSRLFGWTGRRPDDHSDDSNAAPPATSAFAEPAATFTTPGSRPPVAILITPERDPQLSVLRGFAAAAAEQAMSSQPLTAQALLERRATRLPPTLAHGITGGPPVAEAQPSRPARHGAPGATEPGSPSAGDAPSGVAPAGDAPAGVADEDCVETRRVASERCSVAARARAHAASAQEALRESQRSYDDHQSRAERATETADPRMIRSAKDAAQQAFRSARAAASATDAIEAAARDWLSEINRINRLSRDASASATHEREAAANLVTTIERLSLEADAARISAESAEAACLAARQASADCEEAAAARKAGRLALDTSPVAEDEVEEGAGSGALITEAADPAILRMLRGDRAALTSVVTAMAGSHPEEVRRWRLIMSTLVDEILARAIETSCLAFPLEHPFWGPFTLGQNRDIATALASLGYRFDGLGDWVDDRVPGQRDLSLAVGYAGLDPMRIRHWPTESQIGELFRDVTVAGDEYLVETAGDLTLGELVTLLGPRADDLAELWNDWGRARPLLLSD
jgi:hypothetical protein